MKKYLFGLGAMLVGAGLMFALMHGEVSADSNIGGELLCKYSKIKIWRGKEEGYKEAREAIISSLLECKSENITCYILENTVPYYSALSPKDFNTRLEHSISCMKE